MQERIDRDIKKAKNMFFMQQMNSNCSEKSMGLNLSQKSMNNSKSGLRILSNSEQQAFNPEVPTLNTPPPYSITKGLEQIEKILTDRREKDIASTERTVSTFRSSESSATSRKSSREKNSLRRDPAEICFSSQSYDKPISDGDGNGSVVKPGMDFYLQYFRSSMSFASFVENWKYIQIPATLVYSYKENQPQWLWLYKAHDGMRRLEFRSNDEVRDFMAAFVSHLAPSRKCEGEKAQENIPKALLSKRSNANKKITVEPLFTATQIQGAIFEILDCPKARSYATSYAVIQKFSKDSLSPVRHLQKSPDTEDEKAPEKKVHDAYCQGNLETEKAMKFFSVKNIADVESSAFTVEVENFVSDSDETLKDKIIVKKLIGKHLRLIEGSLTRMINEMERTISKGLNRQLENLVIDFSIGEKKEEGKRVE